MIKFLNRVIATSALWLVFTSSFAIAADSKVTELQKLESIYIESSDQAEVFQKRLIDAIQDKERSVRRRATYLANLYFDGSPSMLAKLLQLLEPKTFETLSPQARINAVFLATESVESAWNASLAHEAKKTVLSLEPDIPTGLQLTKYFKALTRRVADLPEPNAAVWLFGTIQSNASEAEGQTDIDVFVCHAAGKDSDYSLVKSAHELAKELAKQNFARVRLQPWPLELAQKKAENLTKPELSGYSTVFFDKDYPEERELSRIEKAMNKFSDLPPFRSLLSKSAPSIWYLNLFICP